VKQAAYSWGEGGITTLGRSTASGHGILILALWLWRVATSGRFILAKLTPKQIGLTVALAIVAAITAKGVSYLITNSGKPSGPKDISVQASSTPAASVQASSTPAAADMWVTSATESSYGVTEDQMGADYLDAIGKRVVENLTNLALKAEQNGGPKAPPFTSEGTYEVMSGKKLGVIKIRSQGRTPMAVIIGIDKQELIKVSCLNKEKGGDIVITTGKCRDEINKAFKLS
jgi:hypothetical protein